MVGLLVPSHILLVSNNPQKYINKSFTSSLSLVLILNIVFSSSWFDHVKDWYCQMDNFDMLFLTYEEMKKARHIQNILQKHKCYLIY